MKRLLFAGLLLGFVATATAAPTRLDHGRFDDVRVYAPTAAADRVALWLGEASGWSALDDASAAALSARGTLVIGVDGAALRKTFAVADDDCLYPAGDLENLSRFAQAYTHQPTVRLPVLAGDPALVYAVLAQAPPGHFAGGVTTAFAPALAGFATAFCEGDGLTLSQKPTKERPAQTLAIDPKLANPLVVLAEAAGDASTERALATMPAARFAKLRNLRSMREQPALRLAALQGAIGSLAAQARPLAEAAPADLEGLPVIEDRAPGVDPNLVVFWSGDGGWATIDKEVSDALQKKGISAVGVDSLRYFWKARTPEEVARDTAAIARHYFKAWNKSRLVLIGFSQGADVLPFAISRLDSQLRSQLVLFVAMGLSDHAVFEFEVTNWVSDNNDGPPIAPEMAKLKDLPVLCLYGQDDEDSVCPSLKPSATLKTIGLPGDHHFNGDYQKVADLILAALKP